MTAINPYAVSDADLEKMGDTALAELEDRLLLDTELDLSTKSQFTAGRVVVFVLSAICITILLALMSRLPTEKLGPLNIPLYLLALLGGAVSAHWLWSAVGRRAREVVRWLLGHWPVVLYLVAAMYWLVAG